MPRLSKTAAKLPPYDLKAEREKHNLTQHELADLLFTSQASVARWETEGNLPQIFRAYLALYWKAQKPVKRAKAA